MTTPRLWVLGAADPEMAAIATLLAERGECVCFAVGPDGDRVDPGSAYRAIGWRDADGNFYDAASGSTIYCVECYVPYTDPCTDVVAIDHHRPGDPGYGRPPAEFLTASSIGQVMSVLGLADVPSELVLTAAADHCLAAAYRGQCPGVDPDALMRWRVASRAAHQRRSEAQILADIELARVALRAAPSLILSVADIRVSSGWDDEETSRHVYDVTAKDMRGRHVPELPEASAREGICFVADGLPCRDGRAKVVCQSGTPEQISAFMRSWAPSAGLVDIYGDPARGFAGGYASPGRGSSGSITTGREDDRLHAL